MPSYYDYLLTQADQQGNLNDFLSISDGRLFFAELDPLALATQHGSPLEVSFCPQITRRVQEMQALFAQASRQVGYQSQFVYAYATKANFAEQVIRTAITAGAHYETSSPFDVRIAHKLYRSGVLPADRFVFCNGSKEPAYINAILELRRAGFANVVPILDDPEEFEALADCELPLLLGLRERKDAIDLREGATYGYDRFGMSLDVMRQLAQRVAGTRHMIILYHAMVGSQLEDEQFFIREIRESLQGFAMLRESAPTLDYFNFGGGFPTAAYSLDFDFDYAMAIQGLLETITDECQSCNIQPPNLIGEFGRYTVADHGMHIFHTRRSKHAQTGLEGALPWYLIDGSLMVALPDILIVAGQEFIALALNHWDAPACPVLLGGRRTCDSDDFYPRDHRQGLVLPWLDAETLSREPLRIAFFGTGAYQAMLSGEGGAHHCLAPEAPHLIIEEQQGQYTQRLIAEQSWQDVLGELGY